MGLNLDVIDLELCLCGSPSVSVMTFEPYRHQVVCPQCHMHGKTGNSPRQASLLWNKKLLIFRTYKIKKAPVPKHRGP